MMKNSRLNQLLEFLSDDPSDPFNHYAVAIEYRSTEPAKALKILKELRTNQPEYLPTYYHLGEMLIESDDRQNAESVLLEGIELAKSQQDATALRELQNLLNQLLFED